MAENDLQKAANSDLTSSKLEAISTRDLNIDYDHFDDFLSNFENEVHISNNFFFSNKLTNKKISKQTK